MNGKQNIIQQKSYSFALRMIKLYQFLAQDKEEFVISKQILRSGTSIGANIEEAIGGQTKKDFFLKITLSYKEARETHYWLRLLKDCEEILKLLASIQKTTRKNLRNS